MIHTTLALYVVTENPTDFPGQIVVRQWDVVMGKHSGQMAPRGKPELIAPVGTAGWFHVHAHLVDLGLERMKPAPGSDPVIQEVWV